MKITPQQLQERLSWSLNQKIDHALYIIDLFLNKNKNSIVAYSGGIDSTVLLYLCRIINPKIKGVFVNTTNEFSEIIKFVKQTENIDIVNPKITFIESLQKYGFPLISKRISRIIRDLKNPTDNNINSRNLYLTGINSKGIKSKSCYILPKKYYYLIDVQFDITDKCCDYLKKQPMNKFKKSGIIIGTSASDSLIRKKAYLQTGCINYNQNKCQPLSILKKEDNWKIIKDNKLSYCILYDQGEKMTGCAYCGYGFNLNERLNRLEKREPKRFNHIMNIKNNGVTYREAINIILKS